jgi:hypothetical protein
LRPLFRGLPSQAQAATRSQIPAILFGITGEEVLADAMRIAYWRVKPVVIGQGDAPTGQTDPLLRDPVGQKAALLSRPNHLAIMHDLGKTPCSNSQWFVALEEEGFDAVEVFFSVDADGVVLGGGDVEAEAVFEETELLEALGTFEGAGGELGEAVECVAAVGVEADVLPILRVGAVAVVWDGGAGEVEGTAVGSGDDLDRVGIGDVLGGAEDLERGDVDVRVGERGQKGGKVLRLEQGLVALDVDVDLGRNALGDGVDAVGAAGEVGRGELDGPAVGAADGGDLLGVGGDNDVVELRAGAGGLVDPSEHGVAGEIAQDLVRQAGGGETGRDDAEGAESRHGMTF